MMAGEARAAAAEAAARRRHLRAVERLAARLHAGGSRRLAWFVPGRRVAVADRMQRGYSYVLAAPAGRAFAPGFRPGVTPARMLRMGVFEGRYLNDCVGELPREWFEGALRAGRLRPGGADPAANHFGVKSRLSLREWRRRGWVPAAPGDRDVRGWFQWYCRYWLGRRQPAVDAVQVARWRAFARHAAQVRASYARLRAARRPLPRTRAEKRAHRPRQRQALLQWAYSPYL
jgi:hypothetical protein